MGAPRPSRTPAPGLQAQLDQLAADLPAARDALELLERFVTRYRLVYRDVAASGICVDDAGDWIPDVEARIGLSGPLGLVHHLHELGSTAVEA